VKVTGLHLPAEILGLEAISSGVHDYDAVALEDGEVCVLPYPALTQLASGLPALQTHLLELLSADIVRDRGLMVLLGAMTAQQRVASFLIRLSDRYQKLGYAGTRFSMRMPRADLASYLGVSGETVSRIFAHLQRNGLITARSRDVEVIDLEALRSLGTH
jgi:CRP/FNR family transcriptional regulator